MTGREPWVSALDEHRPSHVFGLFSGGHDSLCSTALVAKHPAFTAAVHINTGVGIDDTRTFVRETCAEREAIQRDEAAIAAGLEGAA